MDVKIESSWKSLLNDFFNTQSFINLANFIKKEYKTKLILPKGNLIFNAFNLTSFDSLKVVILGQDPYPNPNDAMGLAFSVPRSYNLPPSLKNIFKELKDDLNIDRENGDLSDWAHQGVLLLNSILTVESGRPGSHRGFGWEVFTDLVISLISKNKDKIVFILWGGDAQKKEILIDKNKHYIIKSPHPSPLSANLGFFGSKPFSKTNLKLKEWGLETIKW